MRKEEVKLLIPEANRTVEEHRKSIVEPELPPVRQAPQPDKREIQTHNVPQVAPRELQTHTVPQVAPRGPQIHNVPGVTPRDPQTHEVPKIDRSIPDRPLTIHEVEPRQPVEHFIPQTPNVTFPTGHHVPPAAQLPNSEPFLDHNKIRVLDQYVVHQTYWMQ